MSNRPEKNRADLERLQLDRLNQLLEQILPTNKFYQAKFADLPRPIASLSQWSEFPTTTKTELSQAADSHGLAPHLTFPLANYTRFHRTSGSTGKPLMVLDTPEDWTTWIDAWQYVLDAACLCAGDVVFMAFSFGPFIGFWSAQDACLQRGCRVVPGGGLSTAARLDLIVSSGATVLFATPSYALHLAATAASKGIDARTLGIRKIVVAGEPGGSIADVRQRLKECFDAVVTDHAGATEVGAWGFGTDEGKSLAIVETEFIAEFEPLDRSLQQNLHPQEMLHELILTNLRRAGAPALRYRTGDIVHPVFPSESNCDATYPFVILKGGILGRSDQMMTIRGVNIFPSAIEAIIRSFPEINEYRLIATKQGRMDQLVVNIEDSLHRPERVAEMFDIRLGLRIDVLEVPHGALERFADKSKRFIDLRKNS